MNVTIVIERLVLDGVPVPAERSDAFGEALALSLRDLLVAHPPGPGVPAPAGRVRGRPVHRPAGRYDAGTVEEIAASLHAVLVGDPGPAERSQDRTGGRR